jgi:asparagine synthase (glutamine-hydrolysing)
MDSNALASCASEIRDHDVDTFTVAFRGEDAAWNEDVEASRFAAQIGVRHHMVPVVQEEALENLEEIFHAFDQPTLDGPNTWIIARAVRRAGISVALSGLGGDEVFAGYSHLRSAQLSQTWFRAASTMRPALMKLVPWLNGPRQQNLRLDKALSLLEALGDEATVYAVRRSLLPPRLLLELASESIEEYCRSGLKGLLSPTNIANRSGLDAQTVLELTNYLPNTLLRDTDVMAMRNALEVRVPFLDEALMEKILTFPGKWRAKRNQQKPLLAAAFPEIGVHKPHRKRGFVLPFANWLHGPLGEDVEKRFAHLEHAGPYLRVPAVNALLRRFKNGEDRLWARIWAIYVLERWIENSKKRSATSFPG